ncbi:glycerate kinase type-2 family protein [Halobaculum limi]|uniref:glycerate kinase type-2 family protein n=1 Tax=Halobaculum limi TaxID=3031916 RepID=UPI00240685FB|nr:DUF4147 domain-containing protein [Halobaculum sp. YSMS11]
MDDERDAADAVAAQDSTASQAVDTARACLRAGIEAAEPAIVVSSTLALDGNMLTVGDATHDLGAFNRVIVVGGGKAGAGVATALENLLGDRIDEGLVVCDETDDDARIRRVRGGHPTPTAAGVEATRAVERLVADADEETLVLAVVTGGASAMLAAPVEAVDLAALRETTDALVRSGASIDEINAVRKHLSRVKGGRLAATAAPATVVTLAFSDVVGDDCSVIGSGPTAPDESTYADALDVLDRYDLDVPGAVRDYLTRGAAGAEAETPGPDDPVFDRGSVHVLASAHTALTAAAETARDRGYEPMLLSARIRGEAREVGRTHAAIAEELADSGNPVDPPAVVISGGETTVTVRGDGNGGPNLECALAAAVEFADGRSPVQGADCAFLAADTDGNDGGTDHAGAVVTPETVADAAAARSALGDNDALGAFTGSDWLVTTDATGTNVNDFRIVVVEGSVD